MTDQDDIYLEPDTAGEPAVGEPPASGRFLDVRDLRVHFPTDDGVVKSVDGLSFHLDRGRTLGIVGESGSGKSVTSLSIMGLHKAGTAQISGEIMLNGQNLVGLGREKVRRLRGKDMAMIFQDPLSSLHPFYKVGAQIAEGVRAHKAVSKAQAWDRAVEMLALVGIPEPRKRADAYPHEFSGGMRQRAMIAMALANNPKLLVADEPTTALDVMVQAQILRLLEDLQAAFGLATLFITHDLSTLAAACRRIAVMYAGRIVEEGPAREVFAAPAHPYTAALAAAFPVIGDPAFRHNPSGLPGDPPDPRALPSGCPFHPRCPDAHEPCPVTDVALWPAGPGRRSACVKVVE